MTVVEVADAKLNAAEREDAREIFEGRVPEKSACHFCAGIHAQVAGLTPDTQPCPRIKRIERHTDGTVLVLEHWPPGTWETDVVFPADAYEEDESDGE